LHNVSAEVNQQSVCAKHNNGFCLLNSLQIMCFSNTATVILLISS